MTMNPNLGHPVSNKHKVPKKQWDKWNNFARKHFNDMMEVTRPSMQVVFNAAPHAPLLDRQQWHVLRWNLSWEAAHAINNRTKHNG